MYCGPPNQNFGWAAYPGVYRKRCIYVSSPSGVRGGAPNAVAFCCIACSQNASGCNNVSSSVSIAISGKSFKLAK